MATPMRVGFSVAGDAEVKAALEGVKEGVKNRVLKDAVKKVGSRGNKKSKESLRHRRTRQLYRSIGLRPKSYKRGAVFLVVIGPRRGFKIMGPDGKSINPTQYAHLVERGRKALKPTAKQALTFVITRGRGKGSMRFARKVRAFRGTPFMGPSLEYMRLVAPWMTRQTLVEGIAREAAKYAARGKTIQKG
jgi:hypothetical protein